VIGRWALAETPAPACLAVVDALRDHWFVARIERRGGEDAGPPRRLRTAELASELHDVALTDLCLAGFGASRLAAAAGLPGLALEPVALAPAAAHQAAERPPRWDATLLTRPLYLQAPAVTVAPGRS
jgi:tRNA A37 threonylcarbamoyladenosine modification protein TsaB